MLAVTRPRKYCLHWSEFSGMDRENMEKLRSLGSDRHVACLTWARVRRFLPQDMVHSAPAALHDTIDTAII